MPRKSKQPQVVSAALRDFTLGQLQAGVKLPVPTLDRKPDEKGHHKITYEEKHLRGTGIPASTLAKFRSGEWKPGPKSVDKIVKFVRAYKYNVSRASGFNVQESKKARYHSTEKWRQQVLDRRVLLQSLAAQRTVETGQEVRPEYLMYWAARTSKRGEDIDSYTNTKKFKPTTMEMAANISALNL